MSDNIVRQSKAVNKNVVVYIIATESGEQYRVTQILRHKDYVETIYLVMNDIPQILRQVFLPLNILPSPNFKDFIEIGDKFRDC